MPCYDPRDDPINLSRDIDQLTDLLCKAGRAYVNNLPMPQEVLEWWREHRKDDEARGEKW